MMRIMSAVTNVTRDKQTLRLVPTHRTPLLPNGVLACAWLP